MHRWSRTEPRAPRLDVVAAATASVERLVEGRSIAGKLVAVGVGSRGLPEHARLVRTVVDALRGRGARPLIVAAMGSHGGDADGQRALLERDGITEATMGVPLDFALQSQPIGTTPGGVALRWSAAALRCDLTLIVNRVALHPNLSSALQSGLTKMSVIGLGKTDGAAAMHAAGVSANLAAAGEHVRARTNFIGGVAMVCDGDGAPERVVGVRAEELPDAELALLERARALRFGLPLPELDVLVVDWFGKNVSPTGIDRRLVGRGVGPDPVKVSAIVALGLTPESRGNGLGVGFAEAVTARVVGAIDAEQMRFNMEASGDVEACTIGRVFASDAAAVDWAIAEFGPRVARLESTAKLRHVLCAEGLEPAGLARGARVDWGFDDAGWLDRAAPWSGN